MCIRDSLRGRPASLRRGPSEPFRGHIPTGAVPLAGALWQGNLGRCFKAPRVAMRTCARP
eukprot:7467431-Alexandrium_andersonii.AAC.1